MFSAALLVVGCLLLQRNPVTTEGHRGTNRHVFYALRVDGGPAAARALAEQHGLEFILRVSACLRDPFFCLHMWAWISYFLNPGSVFLF